MQHQISRGKSSAESILSESLALEDLDQLVELLYLQLRTLTHVLELDVAVEEDADVLDAFVGIYHEDGVVELDYVTLLPVPRGEGQELHPEITHLHRLVQLVVFQE
jgi:hypothetical protein